jgi:SAM-dependent methyltransferase
MHEAVPLSPALSAAALPLPLLRRRVLHVGCGYQAPHRLHATFRDASAWDEIRLDIDERVKPDIVCSTVDMSSVVPSGSVDAVWSSHTIEHLYDHEVPRAFAEFRRVLKPSGLLLIRCPDIEAVLQCFLEHGPEHVAYVSPAGPITPLDMVFGHRASIEAGNPFMAHHTGFTAARIATALLAAGFAEVRTRSGEGFDLWTLALAPEADVDEALSDLEAAGLPFLE